MNIAAVSVPVDRDGMVVSDGMKLAPRARAAVVTPAHQSPLCVSLVLAPAPGAVGLGCAKQRMGHRGRLRRRVSLCQPAAACVEELGSRWARALCRHIQQGAFSGHPAWHISSCRKRRSSGLSRSLKSLQGGSPRAYASDRHGLHRGRAFRAPYPADAEALCRASGGDSSRPGKRAGQTHAN